MQILKAALMVAAALSAAGAAQTPPRPMAGMATAPERPCPAIPAPLPADYAGWAAAASLTAATNPRELALATLRPGQGARATLAPSDRLSFPLAPEHAPAIGSHSGLFAFAVTRAGTYRVALGGAAWVDVVKDGHVVTSSAHGRGADCSGIRKVVAFPLEPGRYLLQVSGADATELRLMVAPIAE